MKIPKEKIRKVLIVTLSNLGDAVLTLPVFEAVTEAFGKAAVHVVAGKGAACVFKEDPRIQKLTVYDKKMGVLDKIKFLRDIRRERYDLIVDLKYSLVGLLGGARYHNSYWAMFSRKSHRALRHLDALNNLAPALPAQRPFLKADTRSPEILFSKIQDAAALDGRSASEYLLGPGPLVVAAVGSKSDVKKWPAEYFARLLDRLAIVNGCRLILAGDVADRACAQTVKGMMRSPVVDLTGETDFRELCSLVGSAAMLITNDSAPLHVAEALKTPCLAIFGPTDPKKYGPRFAHSQYVSGAVFCAPCEKAQCRYRHECMNELSVDEVYRKALEVLADEFRPKDLNILIVRLDRIGDVVLSQPAVQAVREHFPNARISMAVRPATQGVAEANPALDEVIPYFYESKGRHSGMGGSLRFVREIIRRRFDVAFILHPSLRAHLFPFLSGIPYRIGFDAHASFLLTNKVPDRRREGLKHESEYALEVVRAFGIEASPNTQSSLAVYPEDGLRAEEILRRSGWAEGQNILAIHPGASCPSKRWPKERFLTLALELLARTTLRVAVIGGKEEIGLGQYLSSQTQGRLLDLTGMLSLKELAYFLKKCKALVSNDSGPVHVAAAVGTRTLCIFGRNSAGLSAHRWRPLGKGHTVLQKDIGCVVCLAHDCTIDFECLKAIEAEEVFSEVMKLVGDKIEV